MWYWISDQLYPGLGGFRGRTQHNFRRHRSGLRKGYVVDQFRKCFWVFLGPMDFAVRVRIVWMVKGSGGSEEGWWI